MPNAAVTAFLRQIANDENLQQGLVGFAAHHGFHFTARDLGEVDFQRLADDAPPTQPDDLNDEADPGFGMGEFPA